MFFEGKSLQKHFGKEDNRCLLDKSLQASVDCQKAVNDERTLKYMEDQEK